MKPDTSLRVVVPLLFALSIGWTLQAEEPPHSSIGGEVIHGGNLAMAKAGGDTINLMASHNDPTNGPGEPLYYGDFEDASGNPAWNGWTHRDLTQPEDGFWSVSNYNQPDIQNHAAWCGDIDIPSCDGGVNDPDGGYGNGWHSILEFRQAVPYPSVETSVTVTATLIHDTEPGYDYTYLSYQFEGESHLNIQSWDGNGTVSVYGGVTYLPNEYLDGTDIAVSFRFTSDSAYSDEDCFFRSAGACQIDDINVRISNGDFVGDYFEDFEHGGVVDDFGLWSPVDPVGVGDFAKIWSNLEDLDPCVTNYSPQVAFIDDGVVVPGTGGTWCINWCYGPGGYIVNTSGGLAGGPNHIHNAIESPVMAWPDAKTPGDPVPDGINLSFSAFVHEDLSPDSPGIFFTWAVRSADTDNSAGWGIQNIAYQGWEDRNFVYYGGPSYTRYEQNVSDLMYAGRDSLQVQLAIYELGWVWGWDGDDGYPAPYFDDVTIKIHPIHGPAMAAKDIEMAQDNFPASGIIDIGDLGSHSVRFDMAKNIALDAHLRNDPGDSIVVDIHSLRTGADIDGEPRLNYNLKANPVFDSYRTAGLPAKGWVAGTPASNGTGQIPYKWAFDLPDTGFLFPGDVLHYYISAVDAIGGTFGSDPRTALIPADTTGFTTGFDSPGGYDPVFTMRALPMIDGNKDVAPPPYTALFINDGAGEAEADKWYSVFDHYGMKVGEDYDIYHVNGPSSGVGNGIGGRANPQLLSEYTDILYTSGSLEARTIANGDFNGDPGNDVGTLTGWIDLGDRDIFLAGDGLASDLAQSGPATLTFLDQYVGVTHVTSDVRPFISNQVVPRVQPDNAVNPGDRIFDNQSSWIAYGGCPTINRFDGVEAKAWAVRSAEFLDPAGNGGQYSYAAVTLNRVGDSHIVSMPMDLGYIVADPGSGTHPNLGHIAFLEDIFYFFDIYPFISDVPLAIPGVRFHAVNHPNPFNPHTTITYALPRSGHLKLSVFNVRGQLVKTLVDGVRPGGAGQTVVWDGTDNLGSSAASGIYFYEARSGGEVKVGKMTLLK